MGPAQPAFSLSAEIQQRLLPGPRLRGGLVHPRRVAGAGSSIGGDTFDYSLARDLLHLSLTDAMGHGVDAALTASVCLGGLRGARRRGPPLIEQARETNEALAEHADRRGG